MSEGPVSLGVLIAIQFEQLVVVLPIALLTLWLLRTRWLVHTQRDDGRSTTMLRQLALGAVIACGALAITVLPGLVAGSFSASTAGWHPFQYEIIPDAFANSGGMALLFIVQSLFEETIFHGIGVALFAMLLMWAAELALLEPQQRRFATSKRAPGTLASVQWRQHAWLYSGLVANVVLSVGFAFMHGHNPNVSTMALVNIALAGLWLGMLFWRRVSLLAAWSAHFAWNFGLALLGLPVSGFALIKEPLGFGIDGARGDLLTGGAFGPEASLPAALAFAALTAWLTWQLLSQQRNTATAASTAADSDTAELQAG